MKKFDLLPEIQSIHPEGIAEGERCGKPFNVLLGLPRHWQVEDLVNACERRWQPARVDIWYNLDLQGIAVVTPSVTRILIGATTDIALELKKPDVLTNVQRFASESLETEAWHVKSPPFWIVDEDGEAHVVGRISRSLLRILAVMDELETACALSIASANSQSAPSKKEVGNVSVYLNHLFNAGLVGREKCNAVHRDNAERGWTYTYRSGSSLALRSLMSH